MKTHAPGIAMTVFAALILIMELALLGYWYWLLEPRLRTEAASQAQVLAQAQAATLATALASDDPLQRSLQLDEAIDSLLLLRAPGRDDSFFDSLSLRVDYASIDAEPGSLDRQSGEPTASGFRVTTELYHPYLASLIGVVEFTVSDAFYQAFSADVRRQLYWQGLFIAALLGTLGGGLAWILRQLDTQQSARYAAERALAAQERQVKHLMDNLDTYFVYARDESGRVVRVSESVQRVLGISPETMLEQGPELLTDNPINQQSLQRAHAPRSAPSELFEFELRDPDGGLHRIECTEVPVRDAEGRIRSIDGIAHDVTAQRALEDQLRLARDSAEHANQSKSQFLANMSHEIRTPMNAVIGMATLMAKSPLTSRQRSQLGQLEASARMLMGIIDDILDLSRIEAGKLSILPREFSLDELLTDLTALVGQHAREKGLDVLIDADPSVPSMLVGDAMRLQQVLVNLVVNAIKFTEQGEVVIEIGVVARDEDAMTLRFAVRDSGIGIPPDMLPRLFEQFTQMDESSTRKHGGAGLGLAISKRLVALMGGEMDAESTPGRGSTFWFTARLEPASKQHGREPLPLREGLRALVVDDSPAARDVFGTMLESMRFDVTLADSAERALDIASQGNVQFDLLVIDYLLPGRNGIEAVRELKRRRRCPPSLMITAYADEAIANAAQSAGVDGFLQKPVSPSTLHDATARVLAGQHSSIISVSHLAAADVDARFAPGQRVLLVEDNEINRQVAGELLRGLRLDVTMAENGYVALDTLAAEPDAFGAILMDVQMPGLDGIETTRRIKQDDKLARIPVIALTAHAMASDRERFLAAGMDDYLSKPIEERALIRALARWLRVESKADDIARVDASAGTLPEFPGVDVRSAVARLNGKLPLFLRLFDDFRARYRDAPARISTHLDDGQRGDAAALAHSLKGAAATLGADAVSSAAAEFERAIDDPVARTAALAALDAALEGLDGLQSRDGTGASEDADDFDADALKQSLQALDEALRERRFEAGRLAEDLLRALPGAMRETAPAQSLRTAMAKLDFAEAADQLNILRTQVGTQLPDPAGGRA